MKRIFSIFFIISCCIVAKAELEWECPLISHNSQSFDDLLKTTNKDCKEAALQLKDSIGLDQYSCAYMSYIMIPSDSIDMGNMTEFLKSWLTTKVEGNDISKITLTQKEDENILSVKAKGLKAGGHANFFESWNHTVSPAIVLSIKNERILIYCSAKTYSTKHDRRGTISKETHSFSTCFPFTKSGNDKAEAAAFFYSVLQFQLLSEELYNHLKTKYKNDECIERWRQYIKDRAPMISEYGAPDLTIPLIQKDFNNEINIYEDKEIVLMNGGKKFPFSAFKSCEVRDSIDYIPGQVHTSSTSLGGGMLLFGFGLGTSTSHTTSIKSKDKYLHTYFLDIKTNQISNPFIRIITEDEATAINIKAVFDLIIERYGKQTTSKNKVSKT